MKIMELARLPKYKKKAILIAIFSLFLCVLATPTNASPSKVNKTESKKSTTILQKTKEFCKQNFHKKNKTLKVLGHQARCYLKQGTTGDMDDNPYIKFWAYDLPNQRWHNVGLMPYMQQASTQINSESPAIATKKSALPNQNKSFNNVATDELLEELLGVHTFIQPANPEQKKSLWRNFSFDINIGAGMVFYTNHLDHMRLLQRQKHDYFFETKTNEIYKPNWFHHTLNRVTDFNKSDCIQGNDAQSTAFKGKGLAIPITLGIQYTFWEHLLVGIGKEVIFNAARTLVHNDSNIGYKTYTMPKKWSAQGRWFAKLGCYAFNNEKHRFFGDIRIFHVHHLGDMFSRLVAFGTYLHQAIAYNFGLGYEQQFTNCLSAIARLSVELQNFKQFSNKETHGYNIAYKQVATYVQIGLSIRPNKHLKNKKDQTKAHTLNDVIKRNGLQNLLDDLD